MQNKLYTALLTLILFSAAGCFRQEKQVAEFYVPAMTNQPAATTLKNGIESLPGVDSVSCDTKRSILTATYNDDEVRYMNIEDLISRMGFQSNTRPATPNNTK